MKISISKESVVFQGPAYEDSYWGQVQFPEIFICEDKSLVIKTHVADDSWKEFGRNKDVWCISKNNGLTWERKADMYETEVGHILPNGDRLHFPLRTGISCKVSEIKKARIVTQRLPSDTIIKEADGSWPYPVFMYRDIFGSANYIYDMETLPDAYSKKEWVCYRKKARDSQSTEEKVKVVHPHMSVRGVIKNEDLIMAPFCPYGRGFRTDKEGNIWITSYTGSHLNPYNGGVDIFSASVLYKSSDNGHSFELSGYIPYIPNTTKHPTAYMCDGFTETALEIMDDGSMIVLLRATSVFMGGPEWNTMYIARSTDGGKTFSEPQEFDTCGVLPNLVKLECGVTLAAYGRPGIYLRATCDPSGIDWEDPIEIMTPDDRSHLMNNPPKRPDFHQWAGSCCNVDLKPISPNQAIIAYSDFYYPDQSGKTDKKLKTILTRIITVE
ncbi:MAG: exo-alpha-sialidase [Ruminococcaceae bacterium]|nr:exo-alpha-sialidase [Oscillospiraceae bacterium]